MFLSFCINFKLTFKLNSESVKIKNKNLESFSSDLI